MPPTLGVRSGTHVVEPCVLPAEETAAIGSMDASGEGQLSLKRQRRFSNTSGTEIRSQAHYLRI